MVQFSDSPRPAPVGDTTSTGECLSIATASVINAAADSVPLLARPYDARMWIAMAQCLEKMDKRAEAISTYERVRESPSQLLCLFSDDFFS